MCPYYKDRHCLKCNPPAYVQNVDYERTCKDNYDSCPIYESDDLPNSHTSSVPGSGLYSALIVLGIVIILFNIISKLSSDVFSLGNMIGILVGLSMIIIGIKRKITFASILILVGLVIMVIGLGSLPDHEARDLPMILVFIILGFIISALGVANAVKRRRR